MKRNVIQKTGEDRAFSVVLFLVLGFVSFVMAYPFYYILCYSISDPSKVLPGFLFFPSGWSLQSYINVFTFGDVPHAMLVSAARSVLTPTLMLCTTTCAAYALTKKELFGRKIIMLAFLFTMYIDPGLIPTYMRISSLKLSHSFWVYLLPYMVNVFNLILVKTYMESISPSLEESAWIDGAGYWASLTRIVLPVCMPVLATVALFSIVEQWNVYMDTMLYNAEDSQFHTLSYVLMQYVQNTMNLFEQTKSAGSSVQAINTSSIKMAVTAISIIPIACVYPILQRYFVKGIMVGAIKG